MSVHQPEPRLSAQEYLEIERQADFRSEYLDGEVFPMTGGSFSHNVIVGNLVGKLWAALKNGPCRVCSSDQRVHLPETGLYTYPDVVVVCDEPRFQDQHRDTLLNPCLIAEVLSPTTEAYDRGKKFEHYRTVEPLREYLLVSQDRAHVEQYIRQDGDRWLLIATSGLDANVTLRSLSCELALAEIYEKVPLGSGDEPA